MEERNLFLTNIPVEKAFERFMNLIKPHIRIKNEIIEVTDSLDRVTAEAVHALNNSPLYDSAAMDGVAVISAHTHGASETSPIMLKPGESYHPLDTGDPIRPPFDAVIMAEDIQEADGEGILIHSAAAAWQHVRPVGEDIVKGELILLGGHQIRPIDIGVLLSGGITRILVRKRPEVAIIPTGSEVVEPGSEIKEGDIIESNSRMLEALVKQCGGVPIRFPPVPDEYEMIKAGIRDAAEHYDVVLVCAGTSAGRGDYTVHVLRELGEVAVHGVAMKPGKPVVLAKVNGKHVVGIPGYPVSAYLAYDNFVAPVLEFFSGTAKADSSAVQATLTRRLVSSLKHKEYVRVKVGKIGGRLVASPLARGAGAAMSLVRADGFCVIEQDTEGLEAGTLVNIIFCRDLKSLEHTIVSVGSHDLILDILADMISNYFPGVYLSSANVGSAAGLMAIKNGEAHIAPIHLLDESTGIYNSPIIASLFADRRMALIKGVGRIQGIMTQKKNPLKIAGIIDLLRCRYVNRQRGAGTRVLLDYQLKNAGIAPSSITGYGREAATHMAVAAAIKSDSADAGMGILSAAKAMGLDFIPVGKEDYDFLIPREFLELKHICAFIEMLKSSVFHRKLEGLGGYDTKCCGEIDYV